MIAQELRVLTVLVLLILASMFLASGSRAETATGCHCFQNRAYNPAEKFAADDYILATSFNSLIAKHFDIEKRQIVMLKMKGGVSHLDLITALYAAKAGNTGLNNLISFRQRKFSWQKVMARKEFQEGIKSDPHLAALAAGAGPERIGPRIADSILAEFYTLDLKDVEKLRSNGLNEKEMALVFILAKTKEKKPVDLAARYQNGQSWSEIANALGIGPGAAGKLILNWPAR